jgi:hypothetical protein
MLQDTKGKAAQDTMGTGVEETEGSAVNQAEEPRWKACSSTIMLQDRNIG